MKTTVKLIALALFSTFLATSAMAQTIGGGGGTPPGGDNPGGTPPEFGGVINPCGAEIRGVTVNSLIPMNITMPQTTGKFAIGYLNGITYYGYATLGPNTGNMPLRGNVSGSVSFYPPLPGAGRPADGWTYEVIFAKGEPQPHLGPNNVAWGCIYPPK